jgi:hypothetical protein
MQKEGYASSVLFFFFLFFASSVPLEAGTSKQWDLLVPRIKQGVAAGQVMLHMFTVLRSHHHRLIPDHFYHPTSSVTMTSHYRTGALAALVIIVGLAHSVSFCLMYLRALLLAAYMFVMTNGLSSLSS